MTAKTAQGTVVGLTGGIATGKSTVAGMFAELGAKTIDADKVFHEMLAGDATLAAAMRQAFGEQFVTPEGQVDRRALGRVVFADPQALRRLNQITHGPLLEELRRRLREWGGQGVVVLEAAVLFEMDADALCDKIVATVARPETQVARLVAKGLEPGEAWQRVRAQQRDWRSQASYVINTDVPLPQVREQVEAVWQALRRQGEKQAVQS